MELIILSIIKTVDTIIMTLKTIAMAKSQKVFASLLMAISQFLFYIIIRQVAIGDSMLPIVVISLVSGVGTYLAFSINKKITKDTSWRNVLTCSDKDYLQDFVSFLANNKIKYIVYDCYNRRWDKTYAVEIFSKSKEESKLIDSYLENRDTKVFREIIKG